MIVLVLVVVETVVVSVGDAVLVVKTVTVEVEVTGVAASEQPEVIMLAGYLVRTGGMGMVDA